MIDWLPSARAVVTVGDFTIYWYGVLYVVAFAGVYYLFGRLQQYRQLGFTHSQILELLTWGAVGAVVGGRLGYVLLYEPAYYLAQPLEIWHLSHGGMSSHGGLVGVAVAVWLFNRPAPFRTTYLSLFDVIAFPAALGLALGRFGNIINHELYVTPFARAVAVGAPVALAGLCWWALRRWHTSGKVISLFLIFYSVFRFIEEFLREPEWLVGKGWVTWGQVYTLPFFLVGIVLFVYCLKDEPDTHHTTRI